MYMCECSIEMTQLLHVIYSIYYFQGPSVFYKVSGSRSMDDCTDKVWSKMVLSCHSTNRNDNMQIGRLLQISSLSKVHGPEELVITFTKSENHQLWSNIKLRYFECQSYLEKDMFIPGDIANSMLSTECSENNKYYNKKVLFVKSKLFTNYSIVVVNKFKYINNYKHKACALLGNTVLNSKSIIVTYSTSLYDLELCKKGSTVINFKLLDYKFKNHKEKVGQLVISAGDSRTFKVDIYSNLVSYNIYLPDINLPHCRIYHHNGNCDILMSRTDEKQCIAVISFLENQQGHYSWNINFLSEPKVILEDTNYPEIYRYCKYDLSKCSLKFISWIEASELCKNKSSYLPSINSFEEMNLLYQKIKEEYGNNWKLKLLKNSSIEVLYQPVGIYIGLQIKVR